MATKTKAAFNWADPLLLDQQITGDERAVRDAAHAYCQEKLAPRVLELCGARSLGAFDGLRQPVPIVGEVHRIEVAGRGL